jgi:hypothetical protein
VVKEHAVIELDEESIKKSGGVVAKLPKEQLKSLFYLFTAKPDSRIKVFHQPVFVDVNDVVELNDCITRKLQTHNIDSQVTTITASYKGAEVTEFGTWMEFKNHHWQEAECIEEIVIKWDFMVAINAYEVSQRHTLLVRISSEMKPGKFLQMMATGNSDDFENIDILTAPGFCRVDFINAQISKELINQVSDWFKGRKMPRLIPGGYSWFKKQRQNIARFTHHTFPLMFCLLWIVAFHWFDVNKANGDISMQNTAVWLFLGMYLFGPVADVGNTLASRIFTALEHIGSSKVVFEFTSGDKKANSELLDRNVVQGRKFIKEVLLSLMLNIIAGLIATYLYMNT